MFDSRLEERHDSFAGRAEGHTFLYQCLFPLRFCIVTLPCRQWRIGGCPTSVTVG
jgi:hypothetical protein